METKEQTQNLYTRITDIIIKQLEEGTVPWRQPCNAPRLPRNLISMRPYQGINHVLLRSLNYADNFFLTYNQVKDLGAIVRKGEEPHLVVFLKTVEGELKGKANRILRHYFVFNVAQCENIPERCFPGNARLHPIVTCENILDRMPQRPEINHNGFSSFYNSAYDCVNLPLIQTFASAAEYYATLFHELIHATGHESRLYRKELVQPGTYGSETYSIEELTAEIGACYLCTFAGIPTKALTNNMAYIDGWLGKLKKDKKFILYASAQAQKAVDFILGANFTFDETEAMLQKIKEI